MTQPDQAINPTLSVPAPVPGQAQVKRLAWDLIGRHKYRLNVLLVMTIVGFMSMSYGHWLFGEAVNAMKAHVPSGLSEFETVVFGWMAIIILFSVLRGMFLYVMGFFRVTTIQAILHDLRERLFNRVQVMELDWHHQHGAGELVTRTTRDCDMVRNATDATFQLVEIATMLSGSLMLLFIYHWQLAVLPGILVLIAMYMYYRQAHVMVKLNRKTDDAYDFVTQDLTEGIAGVRVVKAFGLEEMRLKSFAKHVDQFIAHGLRAVKYAVVRVPLPQLLVSMAHPWILILGIILIQRGTLTTLGNEPFALGNLLAALMAMTTLIFRLDGMGSAMRMIAEAIASMQRLSEVIYAEERIHGGEQALAAGPMTLTVNGAQVKDEKGHWILRDCSFELQPGEIVALIGATGSGKSILCSLLPRLKEADGGSVELRDQHGSSMNVNQWDLTQLRKRVQVVPQESFLFSETIAGNIRMGKPEASDDDIWFALANAGIDDFVRGLPKQLATSIGERGMNLSGGQKQRMCIARAMVGTPDILILDDSTSALDSLTEQRIFKVIREQTRGASVLLVTTRLSSVLLADRVLLLDGGKIIANGTHRHLAEQNMRYRELLCLDQESRDE